MRVIRVCHITHKLKDPRITVAMNSWHFFSRGVDLGQYLLVKSPSEATLKIQRITVILSKTRIAYLLAALGKAKGAMPM